MPEYSEYKVERKHPIADLLRIEFIEKAGMGIRRMRDGTRSQWYPEPEFSTGTFFSAVFRPISGVGSQVPHKHPTSAPQVTPQEVFILRAALDDVIAAEIRTVPDQKDRVHFLKQYLEPALEKGLIERTIPDKTRGPKQRYRITDRGRRMLELADKENNT